MASSHIHTARFSRASSLSCVDVEKWCMNCVAISSDLFDIVKTTTHCLVNQAPHVGNKMALCIRRRQNRKSFGPVVWDDQTKICGAGARVEGTSRTWPADVCDFEWIKAPESGVHLQGVHVISRGSSSFELQVHQSSSSLRKDKPESKILCQNFNQEG